MPPPDDSLLPGDHELLGKLHKQMYDWIWAGTVVRQQGFYRLAIIMSYGADIAAVVGGLGFGGPIAAYLKGDVGVGGAAAARLLQDGWIGGSVGILALIVWGLLRIVATRQDVSARAVFARDFANTMHSQMIDLELALHQPNPMPAVLKIQKIVDGKVQEAARAKHPILPWSRLPPNRDAQRELAKRVWIDHIRKTQMANWAPRQNKELRDDG